MDMTCAVLNPECDQNTQIDEALLEGDYSATDPLKVRKETSSVTANF